MLRLKSRQIFPVPNNPHMLCLGQITKGLREFWCLLCVSGAHQGKCYIEEYVPTTVSFSDDIFGNFKFIQDDEEAEELTRFAEQHKLTDIRERAGELVETDMGRIVFG
jgi:hypothetical protein